MKTKNGMKAKASHIKRCIRGDGKAVYEHGFCYTCYQIASNAAKGIDALRF